MANMAVFALLIVAGAAVVGQNLLMTKSLAVLPQSSSRSS
jgi:hypothetical protein